MTKQRQGLWACPVALPSKPPVGRNHALLQFDESVDDLTTPGQELSNEINRHIALAQEGTLTPDAIRGGFFGIQTTALVQILLTLERIEAALKQNSQ